MKKLYFYRKGVCPDKESLKYYDHGYGWAGFTKKQNKGFNEFVGTIGEFRKYLTEREEIKRAESSLL